MADGGGELVGGGAAEAAERWQVAWLLGLGLGWRLGEADWRRARGEGATYIWGAWRFASVVNGRGRAYRSPSCLWAPSCDLGRVSLASPPSRP